MQFYLQSAVVDKGLGLKDLGAARLDVTIGSILVSVVAFFKIMTCAATLFKAGVQVEKAEEPLGVAPPGGSGTAPGFLRSVCSTRRCSPRPSFRYPQHIRSAKLLVGNPVLTRNSRKHPNSTVCIVS